MVIINSVNVHLLAVYDVDDIFCIKKQFVRGVKNKKQKKAIRMQKGQKGNYSKTCIIRNCVFHRFNMGNSEVRMFRLVILGNRECIKSIFWTVLAI